MSEPTKKDFKRLKEKFLSQYDEATARNYSFTLNSPQVERFENHYNKDISQFNDLEAKELLASYRARSLQALISKKAILNKYTNFIKNDKRLIAMNFYQTIDTEALEKLVSKKIQDYKYLSKAQIWDIVGLSPTGVFTYDRVVKNDQDAALIMAIMEGVKGERWYEISNLKLSDVNSDTNEITLYDKDESTRVIKVRPETIEFLERAASEKIYNSYTEDEERPHLLKKELKESPYILKKVTTRSDDRLKYQGMRDRFKEVMRWHGNNDCNMSDLWWSGMFIMAREIRSQKGDLNRDDFLKIAEKYGFNVENQNMYSRFKNKILKHI